ncbi:MAG: TldD/PmbA family protein [candidate division Zixibacteria bacterium]|nr:TldD/PmbA family protein [candidate division Zixibacteria bacterium]
MNSKERLALAHWVATEANKNGADEAAVNLSNSRDVSVQFRDRTLEELNESVQNSLSLSIYANHRYSAHTTNDLRKESLERFISEAVAMTKYLSEDEFRTLPDPKHYTGREDIDLQVYDEAYESVTSDERIRIATAIEDAALGHSDRLISCTTGFNDSLYESVKVHSNGFEGVRRGTSFSAGAEATVKGDGDNRPEDWDWRTVRFLKDMPAPEQLGINAVNRALGKLGQKKIESGTYDMIIENRTAGRFIYPLYGPMQASSLQQKNSWLDGKQGERIASDKLTMIDDPFIKSGLGSRLFDGDGIATKQRTIVDKGILKSYYIDWYYGRKMGLEPTVGSSTNLTFGLGNRSLDEMVKGLERGILVTGFIGGNSNSLTGDFSYGIMGKLIENGQVVHPVNEMNISGILVDIWNQLEEMGNDEWVYSSWRRPSMYFKDVQFSGI